MKVSLTDKSKISQFSGIFKHLKNVSNDQNIYFDTDKMYTQGMDSSHACLFELQLKPEWFNEYNVEKQHIIGINCELMFKVFNCLEISKQLK